MPLDKPIHLCVLVLDHPLVAHRDIVRPGLDVRERAVRDPQADGVQARLGVGVGGVRGGAGGEPSPQRQNDQP